VIAPIAKTLPGATVAVTGETAGTHDFNETMKQHAPLVFAFVLGLAFLLLLVTFRSLVIAFATIVLNLLSVGAAYGVLIMVFQWGNLEGVLGYRSNGAIAAWLPLFLFVILFGLSMDYHVFILSRVREAVNRGMSNDDAVAHGLKSTAGVVTSAALVMVAVFGSFALGSDQLAKQIGIGLAAAILIDATIIRGVLLPATLKLLGERNWYLPKRLSWLPKLEHEPQTAPAAA
jgi:RND superfamily putative drug exporter